ncbi:MULTISPECIES: hypothetical protein [Aeromonas]|uniref:hypothetical protein n=1 Tax=Aeromonas TaxID=642 RepID=UPI002B059E9B|nr:hypothetical protein [Aeromonas jandaei]
MHTTNNATLNAVAIASSMGIDNSLLEAWGNGCVELYGFIGECATLVTQEEEYLTDALNATQEGWPGVFAYEVSEAVATKIRAAISAGDAPSDALVVEWTREQIEEFCRNETNGVDVWEAYKYRSVTLANSAGSQPS